MAANTSVDSDTEPDSRAAYDSDSTIAAATTAVCKATARTARAATRAGYDPRYGEVAGETSYQGGGMPAPGQGEVRR